MLRDIIRGESRSLRPGAERRAKRGKAGRLSNLFWRIRKFSPPTWVMYVLGSLEVVDYVNLAAELVFGFALA